MSTESNVILPPDSNGKRIRALNYILSGQNAASSVWAEVQHIGDPQSGAYLALVNASGALSVSTSGDAVSVSGNIVGVYAASQQSGWMAVVSGVQATSGALTVSSSGLATVAISSGGVVPVLAASFQSGWAAVVSGVGATSGQLNVASSGIGAVAIASGGIIPISIISGNVVALSGIVEIVSGQTVTVVSSGIGTIAVSSGGVIPTILASAQSGGLVGISGGGLTISGGVTISGLVGISGVGNTSGQLNIASSGLGTVAISSGGTLPVGLTGYQSGVLVALSGGGAGISGVAVSVSGNIMLVVSGGVVPIVIVSGTPAPTAIGTFARILGLSGGGPVFAVIAGTDGSNMNVPTVFSSIQGDAVAPANVGTLTVQAFGMGWNGGKWDDARTVAGSSGKTGSVGILATLPAPWTYNHISGGVTVNIWQSGAVFVHGININSYSSGGSITVYDSQSGAAGTVVGVINPDAGALANVALAPATINYDAVFVTGLVVTTTNTNWDLTVFYRGLLS